MMQKIKRLIVTLMILIFSISLLPTNNFVKASDDVNIISTTNLSVEVAKKWAKSKNATNTFINLADLYWKYSSSCGGVNPMIAYVQAALETGYGKFGGVIDESYHNPCGMKVTSGGSDTDANAHYRFNNWDEGVQAHMDHLALYAGANGYPKSNTYDPRHFPSIKGKAKTIKSLEGKWATAVGYGEKLFNLYNDVIAYSKTVLVSRNNIDTKNNVEGDILEVTGWALNGEGISAINIYIDGVFKGTAQYGLARNDVYNVYPEYSNKNSGYRAVIDI